MLAIYIRQRSRKCEGNSLFKCTVFREFDAADCCQDIAFVHSETNKTFLGGKKNSMSPPSFMVPGAMQNFIKSKDI